MIAIKNQADTSVGIDEKAIFISRNANTFIRYQEYEFLVIYA